MKNYIYLFICLVGCVGFGLSNEPGLGRAANFFMAFEGAAFFVVTEIRDLLKNHFQALTPKEPQ